MTPLTRPGELGSDVSGERAWVPSSRVERHETVGTNRTEVRYVR